MRSGQPTCLLAHAGYVEPVAVWRTQSSCSSLVATPDSEAGWFLRSRLVGTRIVSSEGRIVRALRVDPE
jgi:hypothetical protein